MEQDIAALVEMEDEAEAEEDDEPEILEELECYRVRSQNRYIGLML